MENVLKQVGEMGIIPVIKIDRAEDALPLAEALCEGGMPCAEITFRTAAAPEAIRIMSEAYPEMLIGAGTVLTAEQADTAMECGAKFIVSPGLSVSVANICNERNIPYYPGCVTPTEIMQALELGINEEIPKQIEKIYYHYPYRKIE